MWSALAVRDSKMDHTQCLAWNPKCIIVQWVGIGTRTHTQMKCKNLQSVMLGQMVICLPLVWQAWGSIPSKVENFIMNFKPQGK